MLDRIGMVLRRSTALCTCPSAFSSAARSMVSFISRSRSRRRGDGRGNPRAPRAMDGLATLAQTSARPGKARVRRKCAPSGLNDRATIRGGLQPATARSALGRQLPARSDEVAGVAVGDALQIDPGARVRPPRTGRRGPVRSPPCRATGRRRRRPRSSPRPPASARRRRGRSPSGSARPRSLPWRFRVVGSWIWKKNSMDLAIAGSRQGRRRSRSPRRGCRGCQVALGTSPPGISDAGLQDARIAAQQVLDAPETAAGEDRGLRGHGKSAFHRGNGRGYMLGLAGAAAQAGAARRERSAVKRAAAVLVRLPRNTSARSPLAEGGLPVRRSSAAAWKVEIDSAGTGSWHVGDPPDRRSQAVALRTRRRHRRLSRPRRSSPRISAASPTS